MTKNKKVVEKQKSPSSMEITIKPIKIRFNKKDNNLCNRYCYFLSGGYSFLDKGGGWDLHCYLFNENLNYIESEEFKPNPKRCKECKQLQLKKRYDINSECFIATVLVTKDK